MALFIHPSVCVVYNHSSSTNVLSSSLIYFIRVLEGSALRNILHTEWETKRPSLLDRQQKCCLMIYLPKRACYSKVRVRLGFPRRKRHVCSCGHHNFVLVRLFVGHIIVYTHYNIFIFSVFLFTTIQKDTRLIVAPFPDANPWYLHSLVSQCP